MLQFICWYGVYLFMYNKFMMYDDIFIMIIRQYIYTFNLQILLF